MPQITTAIICNSVWSAAPFQTTYGIITDLSLNTKHKRPIIQTQPKLYLKFFTMVLQSLICLACIQVNFVTKKIYFSLYKMAERLRQTDKAVKCQLFRHQMPSAFILLGCTGRISVTDAFNHLQMFACLNTDMCQ